MKPSAGPSLCVRAEEWKIKAIDRRSNEPQKNECDGQTTSKNKENGPFLPREALIYLKTFCFIVIELKREHSQFLRHCRLAKSNQFLHHTHTHTHTDIVVLFLGYVPYPKTLFSVFYVYLFLLYSCFIEFVFISTTEQSAVPAESTSFERHSEFVCMCLNHSDVCFHLKSVPLSFHFRSEILNVLGFKKKTFYRSRSRSSLDFGLICSLIGQLHISGVAQTHTC